MAIAADPVEDVLGCLAGDWLQPEDLADPQAFYKALERVGTPSAEIVESV